MDIKIEKILEFHDIFPETKDFNEIETLKKYNREKIIRCCNVLGNNYGIAYIPDAKSTFFSNCSSKYIDELNTRFNSFSQGQRLCYCTPKTVLELMRRLFSIPENEFKEIGDISDFEYDLFRVILSINERLMNFKSGNNLDFATLTFFSRFVINDLFFTDYQEVFTNQVLYYKSLIDFLENDERCAKAKEKFFKKLGISTMSQYAKTWAGLFTLAYNHQKSKKKGCPILDLDVPHDKGNLLIESVLDYLSIDINAVIPYDGTQDQDSRENNVDYRFFRAHPLIKVESRKYIIYNLPILVERIYNGLFFDIKNYFNEPFSFYNTEFVQKKLFLPQMWRSIGNKATAFFPKECDVHDTERPNQPDFYIREEDCLILFECKAIKLNGYLKDNADIDKLLDELKNKLFLSEKNLDPTRKTKKAERVGVTQLIHQMKMIDEDNFEWDTNIPDYVAYYPVLVLEDIRLTVQGISYILNSWYKPLINKELPNQMCNPIIVMSINTLIAYKQFFKQQGFHKIFDQYLRRVTNNTASDINWELDPLADFDVYMQEKYSIPKKERIKRFNEAMKCFDIKHP